MIIKLKKNSLWLIPFTFAALSAMLLYFSVTLSYKNNTINENDIKHFRNNIAVLNESVLKAGEEIVSDFSAQYQVPNTRPFAKILDYNKLEKLNAACFVFSGNTLLSYTDYKFAIDKDILLRSNEKQSLSNGYNGLYLINRVPHGNLLFVFVIQLQTQYAFENEFLHNVINPHICANDAFGFSMNDRSSAHTVFSCGDKYLDLVVKNSEVSRSIGKQSLALFLFIIAVFLLSNSFYRVIRLVLQRRGLGLWRLLFCFIVFVLLWQSGLWILRQYFLPVSVYFSPELFALSSIFPGLGILLYHQLWILILALVFLREMKMMPVKQSLQKKIYRLMMVVAFFFAIVSLRFIIVNLPDIIYNTSISIDFSDIFSFGWPHLFLFLTLFILFAIAFIFLLTGVMMILKTRTTFFSFVLYYIVTSVVFYLFFHSVFIWAGIVSLIAVFCITCAFAFLLSNRNSLFLALFVITGAVLTSLIINQTNAKKIVENQALLAVSLSSDQDPLSEDLFKDAAKRMQKDPLLDAMLGGKNDDEVLTSYLENHYLTGYLSRYQLRVIRCKDAEQIMIKPENKKVDCVNFFEDIANTRGIPTIADDMYYIDDNNGTGHYLYFFPHADTLQPAMFMELIPISAFKEQGYPELLVDKNLSVKKIPLGYSYARYYKRELINSYGNFKYKLRSEYSFDTLAMNSSMVKDGYVFYKTGSNDDFYLILATQAPGFWAVIAPFPILSLFFLLFAFVLLFFSGNRRRFGMGKTAAYAFKLRLLVISTLILALLVAAVFSVIYFYRLNASKNEQALYEKAYSLNIELERKLSGDTTLNIDDEAMVYELLVKLSGVFFVDVNVYNREGMLITSSRNAIFDKNLISRRMNPEAFNALSLHNDMYASVTENIGSMAFNAAYLPIRNSHNEIIAYMGLPIFSKTSELNREISSFITTFINIYLLLTFITIAISVFFAEYITRPLRFISEKLRNIKLGVVNEKIDWKRSDEIGHLVAEYNRMIDELAEKAEILARSERESAWKEMARQVAHEIKNPLTPMKLSVQYLDRAWNERSDDFDERLRRFTSTMVEQIDNLANIANEFSNFSRMPELEQKHLCVNDVLNGVVTLFRNEEYDIVTEMPAAALYMKADESRLIRIFTNIIKNATQSFISERKGRIDIQLTGNQQNITIIISDNGCGIPDEIKPKIFQPNFTTKSSGTGLGLAMVKNMVESMNGTIRFESESDSGTMFEIIFHL